MLMLGKHTQGTLPVQRQEKDIHTRSMSRAAPWQNNFTRNYNPTTRTHAPTHLSEVVVTILLPTPDPATTTTAAASAAAAASAVPVNVVHVVFLSVVVVAAKPGFLAVQVSAVEYASATAGPTLCPAAAGVFSVTRRHGIFPRPWLVGL